MIDNASARALLPRMEPISFRVTLVQKRPWRGRHAETARVETPTGWEPWGKVFQPRVLHSGMRYAAFSRDRFRRALRLGLSIADGLDQHLAQLDFSLWRFAREGFCPCCHRQHMGMPQGELNPRLSRQGSNVDLDGGFEFTPHNGYFSS
jgi:hypothetical protein